MSDFPEWKIAQQAEESVSRLGQALKISPVLARLLVNRGIETPSAADAFMVPRIDHLHDAWMLPDMEAAVSRLQRAIAAKELISIQGDYDADGTCGTAILLTFLNMMGARTTWHIPSRAGSGYGMSDAAIRAANDEGAKVIISVDNGIACVEEVKVANELGIDVIITDHHQQKDTLPEALANIHPGLAHSRYPQKHLCGAGVAFKLAWALADAMGDKVARSPQFREFTFYALGLVAVASIADIVPLTGENRVLTRYGLGSLLQTPHPGVRALMEVASVKDQVSTTDVGFKIGPRLNAAGRMGREDVALHVLMAGDPMRAKDLAVELDGLNRERQRVERNITTRAKAMLEEREDIAEKPLILVSGEEWAHGVLGIVASRLVDATGKPAIVLCEQEDGIARGSARSTKDFHLYNALNHCDDVMIRFGGHQAAAGVTVERERIDELRERLAECAESYRLDEASGAALEVDVLVNEGELNTGIARDVQALEPFGEGNREPVLALKGAKVVGDPRVVGKTGKHLSMLVTHGARGQAVKAIGFGMSERVNEVQDASSLDLAFVPRISTWRGNEELELELRAIRCR